MTNLKKLRLASVALATLLIAATASAQTYPPAWSTTATYVVGDQVQLFGNVIRAVRPSTVAGRFVYANWELWDVRANTTVLIGVGQTFPTLTAAWTYVQNARVADGVYLHLYISTAHGVLSEPFSQPFALDQLSGARISILGDNASNILLGGGTPFSEYGLTIGSGHAFGAISNVSILGDSLVYGIYAYDKSSIADITGVHISGFGVGIEAREDSHVYVDSNVIITNAEAYSVEAVKNANIDVNYGWSGNSGGTAVLHATFGGLITAHGCTITNSGLTGVSAEYGGNIDVPYSSITSCSVGINAFAHSWVFAESCSFGSNSLYDLQARQTSTITVDASGLSENVDSGTGSYIY
jgi:hypothetical protein